MSKKYPFVLLASLALALPTLSHAEEAFTGRIIGNKVRLRTQPSLEGHVVRDMAQGELFAVVSEENEYYTVQPPKGTKGYVFRTYVLDGVVEAERVNVRLYPDMEAPVIARLNLGDKIKAKVSSVNNKWLEIDLPNAAHFYIAKEYIEKIGPSEMLAELETRKNEAAHHLNAVCLFARSELQKPFEEIDLETLGQKFEKLARDYGDLPDVLDKAKEALVTAQETFTQKKIAFLEQRAEGTYTASRTERKSHETLESVGEAASNVVGLGAAARDPAISDKMQVWVPLEESLYHLWATTHNGETMEDFYAEEEMSAEVLTGIIEPYTRPVKNKPGDYVLRQSNRPVAFLYSTRIDLQEMTGREVTLMATPRPSNHFAFPAYYVLSIE